MLRSRRWRRFCVGVPRRHRWTTPRTAPQSERQHNGLDVPKAILAFTIKTPRIEQPKRCSITRSESRNGTKTALSEVSTDGGFTEPGGRQVITTDLMTVAPMFKRMLRLHYRGLSCREKKLETSQNDNSTYTQPPCPATVVLWPYHPPHRIEALLW